MKQLKADCDRHLRHCLEVPFTLRLQIAHRFRLDVAKDQLCKEAGAGVEELLTDVLRD